MAKQWSIGQPVFFELGENCVEGVVLEVGDKSLTVACAFDSGQNRIETKLKSGRNLSLSVVCVPIAKALGESLAERPSLSMPGGVDVQALRKLAAKLEAPSESSPSDSAAASSHPVARTGPPQEDRLDRVEKLLLTLTRSMEEEKNDMRKRLQSLERGERSQATTPRQTSVSRGPSVSGPLQGLSEFADLWGAGGGRKVKFSAENDDSEEDEDGLQLPGDLSGLGSSDKREGGLPRGRSPSRGGEEISMSDLIQLEMLKQIRKMRKKRGDSSDSDESELDFKSGRADFEGIQRLRKRFQKHPEKFVPAYTTRTKSNLGVRSERQQWAFIAENKRLRALFGKMSGLWMAHGILMEIVQFHHDGMETHAGALAVQGCKALHQVAIDKGDWVNAKLLLPLEEPGERAKFGGDEMELKVIHKYRRAMKELNTKAPAANKDGEKEDP